MPETKIDNGVVHFQAEGRLLQELGERLVASPEVALVELIKNAYDADSPVCSVAVEDAGKTLVVSDLGNGMTDVEFKNKWMRIATDNKVGVKSSKKFQRNLTGQKGIGRFAVRFLGKFLELNTVAWDSERKRKTRLIASFDWSEIDKNENLTGAEIAYELFEVSDSITTGTTLKIKQLKVDNSFLKSREFGTRVINIVTPLNGLEWGRFKHKTGEGNADPGFEVDLPSAELDIKKQLDIAKFLLDRAWARLQIDYEDGKVSYIVTFKDAEYSKNLDFKYSSKIKNGLYADIRFFPRRKGVFSHLDEMSIDGRFAWSWVRDNSGVAVIDHGFRIKPFGFEDDDWLHIDHDNAHRMRDWRTKIAEEYFPMNSAERNNPADSPMLNLPTNWQLVGAVFVESTAQIGTGVKDDLIPSMDREGFIQNEAFDGMKELVRGGLEFLASKDKKFLQKIDEKKAKEASEKVRYDLKMAIEDIKESQTLTQADKNRIVTEYSNLAKNVDDVEEYDKEARRKLETMSLLGVVAGYMTHEAAKIGDVLEDVIKSLRIISKKDASVMTELQKIEKGYEIFKSYMSYTKTFIGSTQENVITEFKAEPQIRRIISHFGDFAKERNIAIKTEIDHDVMVPPMQVTVYSGILLNLYTNALKAILAAKKQTDHPTILFRVWNDEGEHIIEVHDTGVGIPPSLRKRIWDAGFTTTSQLNNPLGTGMGLGLNLVKELVGRLGGSASVIDPGDGYSTCFRIVFRKGKKSK